MNSRRLAKISLALAIVAMVVGGVGFIVLPMLNAFVLDKYNAYGEVPIPGSASLHLPAGKVSVSFHTEVISGPNGGGLPVPQLGMDIDPPPGVPDPAVTESWGGTTTINTTRIGGSGSFRFPPTAGTRSRPTVRSTDSSAQAWRSVRRVPTAGRYGRPWGCSSSAFPR
jgi:hypothetical protein